ncbi:MAG: hypothetical protein L0191_16235 [Acidobacteria bacterium]|nr:hypothetical protein [Acidobacteriota bacterium]
MNWLKRVLKVAALRILLRTVGVVVALAAALFAVYRRAGSPPPTSLPDRAPPAPAAVVATLPPEEKRTPAEYQSSGRRDPFRQSLPEPAQKEPEVNLKVTGIVQGPRSYYALVESELPDGKGYVIRENDVVDAARVLKITKQDVIFEVKTKSAEGKPLTRYVRKPIGP